MKVTEPLVSLLLYKSDCISNKHLTLLFSEDNFIASKLYYSGIDMYIAVPLVNCFSFSYIILGQINFLFLIPVCKMMNLDSSMKSPRQVWSFDMQSMMAWQVKLCVISRLTKNLHRTF